MESCFFPHAGWVGGEGARLNLTFLRQLLAGLVTPHSEALECTTAGGFMWLELHQPGWGRFQHTARAAITGSPLKHCSYPGYASSYVMLVHTCLQESPPSLGSERD